MERKQKREGTGKNVKGEGIQMKEKWRGENEREGKEAGKRIIKGWIWKKGVS